MSEVLSISLITLWNSTPPSDAQRGEIVDFLQSSGLTMQLWTNDSVRLSGTLASIQELLQVKIAKYSVTNLSTACGTYFAANKKTTLPSQLAPFFDREGIQFGTTSEADLRSSCRAIMPG